MKNTLLYLYRFLFLLLPFSAFCQAASQTSGLLAISKGKLLKVPAQYATISEAVQQANNGDTIILSPGNYTEKDIRINKAVVISSEWRLTGNQSAINKTCINADKGTLFKIYVDGVEISGLKVMNGKHSIVAYAKTKIIYNHIVNDQTDGISLESGSGGYVAYNLIENPGDDGIDIDIGENPKNIGSDVVVEHNTIVNSHDDGMEIRLYNSLRQNIQYEIRSNIFLGSGNDGIQLISYDVHTGKVFNIHHNIFKGCNAAIGCMEGANTVENLNGSSKMDEWVYFYNNTIVENKIAATGGNNMVAVNNVVYNNVLGGFKRFGNSSVISNNLFFNNNNADFIEAHSSVIKNKNLFQRDPLLDKGTFTPGKGSPCINSGVKRYVFKGETLFNISANAFSGPAPNLGAVEAGNKYPGTTLIKEE